MGWIIINLQKEVDVISWDSYPAWHSGRETTAELASNVAFVHDLYRSLKGRTAVSRHGEYA
ncbi:hypothetical protein BsIDN1_69960 [Bacillus safensis]|uniref:Glycoside hydrolase family 42 N-terminal domain-containing protein n=1 Tax=Bacillus safensis TaxID=561879 RepID=A0A5S9MJU2_BACIA|nr:hypothetical protein BsIDN1_69960 [Bacillus safensis]